MRLNRESFRPPPKHVRKAAFVLIALVVMACCQIPALVMAQNARRQTERMDTQEDRQYADGIRMNDLDRRQNRAEKTFDDVVGKLDLRMTADEKSLEHLRSMEETALTMAHLFQWLGIIIGPLVAWGAKLLISELRDGRRDVAELRRDISDSRHATMNLLGVPIVMAIRREHPKMAEELADSLNKINAGVDIRPRFSMKTEGQE